MLKRRGILTWRKRGLSAIVTTLILVVLTFVLVSIIWTVVNRIVNENLEEAQSCFAIFDKVSLNSEYTCYDSGSDETLFSINIGDIDVDGVLVVITESGNSRSYTLTYEDQSIAALYNYPDGTPGEIVVLPGENAGRTYVATGFTEKPSSVEIAPIVNGKQCDASDSLLEVDFC